MNEYVILVGTIIIIVLIFSRTIKIETDSANVIERKILFIKSSRVATRGNHFIIPYFEWLKRDNEGNLVCFSSVEFNATVPVKCRFNDSIEVYFEIEAKLFVKNIGKFLDWNDENLSINAFVQAKLKGVLEKIMQEKKPEKLNHVTLEKWATESLDILDEFGIEITKLKTKRQKLLVDAKNIPDDVITAILSGKIGKSNKL